MADPDHLESNYLAPEDDPWAKAAQDIVNDPTYCEEDRSMAKLMLESIARGAQVRSESSRPPPENKSH